MVVLRLPSQAKLSGGTEVDPEFGVGTTDWVVVSTGELFDTGSDSMAENYVGIWALK